MRKTNVRKYRNTLPFVSMAAWTLLAVIVCVAGSSFVYIREQHRAKEHDIKDLARKAHEIEDEIKSLELQILGVTDRKWLRGQLDEWGSPLRPIRLDFVEVISAKDENNVALADVPAPKGGE